MPHLLKGSRPAEYKTPSEAPEDLPTPEVPLSLFVKKWYFWRNGTLLSKSTQKHMRNVLNSFLRWRGYDPEIKDVTPEVLASWAAECCKKSQRRPRYMSFVLHYAYELRIGGVACNPKVWKKKRQNKSGPLSEAANTLWGICISRYFKSSLRITSEDTKRQYRIAIQDFREYLGHEPKCADLSDEVVIAFVKSLKERKLAVPTINECRGRITALWNWMAKKRIVKEFPALPQLKEPERTPKGLDPRRARKALCAHGHAPGTSRPRE
jgi:hypothetical protein